jgi:hypothetical protein
MNQFKSFKSEHFLHRYGFNIFPTAVSTNSQLKQTLETNMNPLSIETNVKIKEKPTTVPSSSPT